MSFAAFDVKASSYEGEGNPTTKVDRCYVLHTTLPGTFLPAFSTVYRSILDHTFLFLSQNIHTLVAFGFVLVVGFVLEVVTFDVPMDSVSVTRLMSSSSSSDVKLNSMGSARSPASIALPSASRKVKITAELASTAVSASLSPDSLLKLLGRLAGDAARTTTSVPAAAASCSGCCQALTPCH